jgi:hypothetical protein
VSRAVAILAALAAVALAACEPRDCFKQGETLHLKVTGSCGPPHEIDVSARCQLHIDSPSGALVIPAQGALDQEEHMIREGGWQLYGKVCPAVNPNCTTPTEFRRCLAYRVSWWIELDCFDAAGVAVCQAMLSE